MRLPAGRVTRTRSPGRSSRAGFALWSFTSTLPPVQAAAASARLLNRRAAQSHLSARTESAGAGRISAGGRPGPHGPGAASARRPGGLERARAPRARRSPTPVGAGAGRQGSGPGDDRALLAGHCENRSGSLYRTDLAPWQT